MASRLEQLLAKIKVKCNGAARKTTVSSVI